MPDNNEKVNIEFTTDVNPGALEEYVKILNTLNASLADVGEEGAETVTMLSNFDDVIRIGAEHTTKFSKEIAEATEGIDEMETALRGVLMRFGEYQDATSLIARTNAPLANRLNAARKGLEQAYRNIPAIQVESLTRRMLGQTAASMINVNPELRKAQGLRAGAITHLANTADRRDQYGDAYIEKANILGAQRRNFLGRAKNLGISTNITKSTYASVLVQAREEILREVRLGMHSGETPTGLGKISPNYIPPEKGGKAGTIADKEFNDLVASRAHLLAKISSALRNSGGRGLNGVAEGLKNTMEELEKLAITLQECAKDVNRARTQAIRAGQRFLSNKFSGQKVPAKALDEEAQFIAQVAARGNQRLVGMTLEPPHAADPGVQKREEQEAKYQKMLEAYGPRLIEKQLSSAERRVGKFRIIEIQLEAIIENAERDLKILGHSIEQLFKGKKFEDIAGAIVNEKDLEKATQLIHSQWRVKNSLGLVSGEVEGDEKARLVLHTAIGEKLTDEKIEQLKINKVISDSEADILQIVRTYSALLKLVEELNHNLLDSRRIIDANAEAVRTFHRFLDETAPNTQVVEHRRSAVGARTPLPTQTGYILSQKKKELAELQDEVDSTEFAARRANAGLPAHQEAMNNPPIDVKPDTATGGGGRGGDGGNTKSILENSAEDSEKRLNRAIEQWTQIMDRIINQWAADADKLLKSMGKRIQETTRQLSDIGDYAHKLAVIATQNAEKDAKEKLADEQRQARMERTAQERYAAAWVRFHQNAAARWYSDRRLMAQASQEYAESRMVGLREQEAAAERLRKEQEAAAKRAEKQMKQFWSQFGKTFKNLEKLITAGLNIGTTIGNVGSQIVQDTIRGFELLWRTGYRVMYILNMAWRALSVFTMWVQRASTALARFGIMLERYVVQAIRTAYAEVMKFSTMIATKFITYLRSAYHQLLRIATIMSGLLVAAVTKAMLAFAAFEQQIKNTGTVLGLMGKNLKMAEESLMLLATTMAQHSSKNAREIASSFYELASAGLVLHEVGPVAQASLALAEGSMADLRETAETLMATMQGMRLPFDQAARVANVFAESIARSPATLHKLTESMRYAAPIAGAFGLSVEETVGALQALYNVGLTGEMAGTGFRQFILRLTSPTSKTIDILKKYGITLDQVNISQRGFIPVVQTLAEAQINATDLTRIFQARALTAASAFMKQSDALRGYVDEVTNTNTAFRLQQQQLQTIQGQWKIFTSIIEAAQIQMGLAARNGVMVLITTMQQLVRSIIGTGVLTVLGQSIGQLAVALSGILQSALPLLVSLTNFVSSMLSRLAAGISNFATALSQDIMGIFTNGGFNEILSLFQALGTVVHTNILAILELVRALVQAKVFSTLTALITPFYQKLVLLGLTVAKVLLANFDKFAAILNNLLARIIPVAISMIEALLELLEPVNVSAFLDALMTAWEFIAEVAKVAAVGFGMILKSGMLKDIVTLLGNIAVRGSILIVRFIDALIKRWPTVIQGLNEIADAGLAVFQTFLQAILYLAQPGVIQQIVKLVQQILGALQRLIIATTAIIAEAFVLVNKYLPVLISIFEVIISYIPKVIRTVIDFLPKAVQWILNFIETVIGAAIDLVGMIMPWVIRAVKVLEEFNATLNSILGKFGMLKAILILIGARLLLPLVISLWRFFVQLVSFITSVIRGCRFLGLALTRLWTWISRISPAVRTIALNIIGWFRSIWAAVAGFFANIGGEWGLGFFLEGIWAMFKLLGQRIITFFQRLFVGELGEIIATYVYYFITNIERLLVTGLVRLATSIGAFLARVGVALIALVDAPVLLILAGIALLAGAIYALVVYWDSISAWWANICASFAEAWENAVQRVIDAINRFKQAIGLGGGGSSMFAQVDNNMQRVSRTLGGSAATAFGGDITARGKDRVRAEADARNAHKAEVDAAAESFKASQRPWQQWADNTRAHMSSIFDSIARGFAGDVSEIRGAILPNDITLPSLGSMPSMGNNVSMLADAISRVGTLGTFNGALTAQQQMHNMTLSPDDGTAMKALRDQQNNMYNAAQTQMQQRTITATGSVVNFTIVVNDLDQMANAAYNTAKQVENEQKAERRRNSIFQAQ